MTIPFILPSDSSISCIEHSKASHRTRHLYKILFHTYLRESTAQQACSLTNFCALPKPKSNEEQCYSNTDTQPKSRVSKYRE